MNSKALKLIPRFLKIQFTEGHERSLRAKKNILASFFIKGLSILISFILVPLTINYVNPTRYGIWLTLSSFIGWFSLADIGLGNGLRNKFAEALAKNDKELARTYVSTTYAILGMILIGILLIFFLVFPFIDWLMIFNAPQELKKELNLAVLFVFLFFILRFFLQILTNVIIADQKPALSDLINLVGSFIALLIIYILTKISSGSLLNLSFSLSIAPVIVLIIASLLLYTGKYRYYSPSYKYINYKYSKVLLTLGVKFFIIQIAYIIIFSTDNFIIAQLFGPKEVVPYNIAFRYFSITSLLFGIIVSPFWSAITEAYQKNEKLWIKKIIKNLVLIWIGFVFMVLIMLLFSNLFYKFWIKNMVAVPMNISIAMAIYVIVITWSTIFSNFINGVGKIKLQMYSAICSAIINIPLAVFLAKYLNFGIVGVLSAIIILQFIGAIWAPIQYLKIINTTAKGIWAK